MRKYKDLLSKEYIFIYFIYFWVFFAIGALDQQIPLFFSAIDEGSLIYGVFLSVASIANIIMPTIAALLSKKFGSREVTIIYFMISISLSLLLFAVINVYIIALVFLAISITQPVFNFSLGSFICVSIDDDKKAKFFAVRDFFLYGSISLGLMLSGILVKKYDIKHLIAVYTLFLLIPCIMLLGRKNIFLKEKMENESREENSFKSIKKAFRNKNFVLMLIIYSFLSIYGAVYAYVPFLAVDIGLNYSEILASFAIVTLINVVVALFLSDLADATNKKVFFIIDVGFDLFPIVIFMFTSNYYIFVAALVLTALKDIFAPITFAYKYEIFGEDGQILISLLESLMGLFTFVLPIVIGKLWIYIGKKVFLIGFVAVCLATLTATFLPKKNCKLES